MHVDCFCQDNDFKASAIRWEDEENEGYITLTVQTKELNYINLYLTDEQFQTLKNIKITKEREA